MKKEQINFCKEYNITEEQFYGKKKISGNLDLESLTSIPKGFNPTVGGGLYLKSLTSIPKGFNPTVGGYLYLNSLTSIPKGFNPTVGGGLYLSSLTSIPREFNPTVGGGLDLSSLTSIPKGFNPTVGGDLYLNSLTSIPRGFNPTVGGSLCLKSLTSIPKGFNPTVGGSLYLKKGLSCATKKIPNNFIFSWQDGKYIRIDGILSEVISKKNNVWKVKNVGSNNITYIVSNGTHFSHGDSIKQARDSLMYKISDRDRTKYNSLTVNSVLPIAKMIECYRVITGACEAGVKGFVTGIDKLKKEYSIKEIIDLTKNQYGNKEFKQFFAK